MAGIVISDKAPRGFDGDFSMTAGEGAAPEEKAYVARVDDVLGILARDDEGDKSARLSSARLKARKDLRKATAAHLRREADEFAAAGLSLSTAYDNALIILGQYTAERDRLGKQQLFTVDIKPSEKDQNLAVDLIIRLDPNLPPPDDTPSPEKEELFVEIGSSITVIGTVCAQMKERAKTVEERGVADRLLDSYIRKLFGIARLGLEGPFPKPAKLALNELRNEFVVREAGRIKNTYVRTLGTASVTVAVPLIFAYVLIVKAAPSWAWWYDHRMFLVAAAGAAIGTWLSFAVRRVKLAFADLAILEEDLLDPLVRVIFVVGLTTVACLLFWTGVMNIEIGSLKTNAAAFGRSGSIALLIGVFCGLSERALATAISGRAAAFVKGIGG